MNRYQVEMYLPKVFHPMAYIPKVRLLHLPVRFGRKLRIKLVDEQLPGRSVSTQDVSSQGVYPKSASTSSTGAFWS